METLVRDVRYALTMMRRDLAFAGAALVTLALGIGATTTVFSVVYGVLQRPLPYPDADRLVNLSEERPGAVSPLRVPMLSNLTYHGWVDAGPTTLDATGAYLGRQYTVDLPGGPARVDGAAVTPSLFGLLGATPAIGRVFLASEAVSGADAVAILSDRLWRERFGADTGIVNRSVRIDGKPHAIVGVAPPGFAFPARDTMMWTPYLVAAPASDAVAGGRGLLVVIRAIGRLKPGATAAQAEAEGQVAARRFPRPMADQLLFGSGTAPTVVHVRTMRDEMTATVRPALLVLASAVGVVLLIACANVANLFLSRGVARQRELTVRAAIGASRARLVRQLLTESLVVSLLGGALGLALAIALIQIGPAFASRNFPRVDAIAIDVRAIAFTAGATILTALVCGLAPALRGARIDLNEALRGGDGATGGFRGIGARRLRRGLLAAEAAFAVLLVVGALLLARSFVKLTRVDAGYTAENVLVAEVVVPGYDAADLQPPAGTAKAEHIAGVVDTALARVRATGDVTAAGAGNMLPLDGSSQIQGFTAPWTPPGQAPGTARTLIYVVTPGYAQALNLRLKAGRVLDEDDLGRGTRAWIVNEEFARLYLPPNPVGYRFEQGPPDNRIPIEIVGVVGNVLKNGNDTKPQPEYYRLPRDQARLTGRFQIAVRTTGDPSRLAPMLRNTLRELEPAAAVETTTLPTRVQASVEQPRFATTVLVMFATLALALASVGLYGVLSYGVAQRRRELGLRAALGAARGDIVALVIREGLTISIAGTAIGLAGAVAVTRLMQNLLFGVAPLDAVSFAAAPIVLLLVALAASLVPARRAAATDPAEALRCE
jgi:putative ABC transport system permease protein